MLEITDIRQDVRPISFEIEPMVTISQKRYRELLEKADRADAILRLALEKQREFRRAAASIGRGEDHEGE